LNRVPFQGVQPGCQKKKVSDKFRQDRILLYLRFHPNDAEEAQCPGDGDVHPFLVQVGYESDVCDDHCGSFQTFEPEESVANNIFLGLGICGKYDRVAADFLFTFGASKEIALPGYCRSCDALLVCRGGCPKQRFAKSPDGTGDWGTGDLIRAKLSY